MDEKEQADWWQKTEALTGIAIAALIFVAAAPLMVSRQAMAFGVPLPYFVAIIVVPVATVATVFLIAGTQERLDRRHGAPRG